MIYFFNEKNAYRKVQFKKVRLIFLHYQYFLSYLLQWQILGGTPNKKVNNECNNIPQKCFDNDIE